MDNAGIRKRPCPALWQGLWIVTLLLFLTIYAPAQSFSPDIRSRIAAGVEFYSQGKFSDAVLELRRAQAEAPSRELRAEALFWISMSKLSAGEYRAALLDMDTLEETDPGNPRVRELPYHRGRALFYLERYDEAILHLTIYADTIRPGPAGVLSPADVSRKAAALYWTGECLFAMGQLDKAADVFRLINEEYPSSAKYEASTYKLGLINQKKVETELLGLLKWSHEESLRNMEEYRRRETSYDQALSVYQKRIADMLNDTRLQDLEHENILYREQLRSAEDKIRSLENTLLETNSSLEEARDSASLERLKTLKSSAEELKNRMQGLNGNSAENGK